MARCQHSRIEQLAGRVTWLDRYRRVISIVAAAVLAPLAIVHISDWLGADWPRVHVTALAVMIAVALWCVIEVALAWITALWETEYDRLLRAGALPRAELVRRK
jgi:hypothetical protein